MKKVTVVGAGLAGASGRQLARKGSVSSLLI